jgi:choline-phosphate cytidylyltransferase
VRVPVPLVQQLEGVPPADIIISRHALQLRQAKLSFPSVHLLVGICSDELCQENKARTVLSHFERLESARQCRWVDQVVPEAPWILDTAFLEKYQIDYVAHDEQPYAGTDGAEDIYKPIKDLGMLCFRC